MVAIIKTSHSINNILNYNENKVKSGVADCINAVNYPLQLEKLNFTLKLNRFLKLAELNENAKRNSVHISLNFDPSENHSTEKLIEIADTYMQKIGFASQPYLVYQHHDAGHPHLHVVTNNIQRDGKRIDLHHLGIRKSEPARKEIEEIFGLVKAEGRKVKEEFFLKPIQIAQIQYGKVESKKAINSVLNEVINLYKYSSLNELNAVLNYFNIRADGGKENSRIYKNKGLVYRILDKNRNSVGVPIKASDLYNKPTLKFLEEKFKSNELMKSRHKARVKDAIDLTFSMQSKISIFELAKQLESAGIFTLCRASEDGRIFGITYIDHKTKCVFNGSSLGKQYSAKEIQERCQLSFVEKTVPASVRLSNTSSETISIKEENNHETNRSPQYSLLNELIKSESAPLDYNYPMYQNKKKKKRGFSR